MRILVACEESQAVCKAFREKGHEAYSCDIIECSGGHPEWHIQGDVLNVLNPMAVFEGEIPGIEFFTADGEHHSFKGKWDMIIAHPPCTYMSKAGARWMYPKAGLISEERLLKAYAAKDFFFRFFNAECDKICVENPVPLKIIGLPAPSQKVQPYEYGHPFSKCTCLWLKGVPNLKPTHILCQYEPYLPSNTGAFSKGKGGSRGYAHDARTASKTFPGIAKAMADQWG